MSCSTADTAVIDGSALVSHTRWTDWKLATAEQSQQQRRRGWQAVAHAANRTPVCESPTPRLMPKSKRRSSTRGTAFTEVVYVRILERWRPCGRWHRQRRPPSRHRGPRDPRRPTRPRVVRKEPRTGAGSQAVMRSGVRTARSLRPLRRGSRSRMRCFALDSVSSVSSLTVSDPREAIRWWRTRRFGHHPLMTPGEKFPKFRQNDVS